MSGPPGRRPAPACSARQTGRVGMVAVALAAAVVSGWLTGGSLERLARLHLPRAGLVPAAVGVQALGLLAGYAGLPPGPSYAAGLAVSALLVGTFLARARGVPGLGLVALGLGLNAVVVAANGAMPVSAVAAARAGAEDAALAADLRHEPLDGRTRLPLLADVVPVALPLRPEVGSAGDVLVAAGLARFVVVGMRRRHGPHRGLWQDPRPVRPVRPQRDHASPGGPMAKRARKRRSRKKHGANHGKRPNA